MNEKNLDYLSKQLTYTGFGDTQQPKLKEAMEKGETPFTLAYVPDFAKENTAVTLHFKKSETQDNFFFNRYALHLTTPDYPDAIKQNFYINQGQDNITLKEAYNLMNGRAVYKEITPKEGEKFNAWIQLDFKQTDAAGNYKLKQFHDNYGFDLPDVLGKHAIADLRNETAKERLLSSLQRGNRQGVLIEANGTAKKFFVEAAPQYKSLNFYDEGGKRVQAYTLYEAPKSAMAQQTDKTPAAKQTAEEEGAPEEKKSKHNRKRVSL